MKIDVDYLDGSLAVYEVAEPPEDAPPDIKARYDTCPALDQEDISLWDTYEHARAALAARNTYFRAKYQLTQPSYFAVTSAK